MFLVRIHAQVTSTAESLLERTLSTLVDELAEEALRCFRQVKRFGMGGMLRVSPSGTASELALTTAPAGDAGDRVHAPDPRSLRHPIRREDPLGSVQ